MVSSSAGQSIFFLRVSRKAETTIGCDYIGRHNACRKSPWSVQQDQRWNRRDLSGRCVQQVRLEKATHAAEYTACFRVINWHRDLGRSPAIAFYSTPRHARAQAGRHRVFLLWEAGEVGTRLQ
jgi:hypothetical protein